MDRRFAGILRKLFFALCLGFAAGGAYPQDSTAGPGWKMAFLKKSGAGYDSLPFSLPLVMAKRDAFRLYLSFEGAGYCYAVLEDDRGGLPLVYKSTAGPGSRLVLPGEGRDFLAAELAGTSRLHVIVSARPKPNLERLIDGYAAEQRGAGTAPSSLERSILSEVFAIRREAPSLPDNPPAPADPEDAGVPVNGRFWRFGGRDTWVVTAVVRS